MVTSTDEDDTTTRRVMFGVTVYIDLPPEGSDRLAENWDGAKTHAEALQHEIDHYRGEGEGQFVELLSFCPSEIVSAAHELSHQP